MNEQQQEIVTIDDLDRIFIRAKAGDSERYVSVSVKEASDLQFDTWAKSRVEIQGEDEPWGLEERADFCNRLWQNGELVMLKKESE